jgi:hypothetical protein
MEATMGDLEVQDRSTYFAQDRSTLRIKIGSAADPRVRVRQLSTGCPGELVLLFVHPNDQTEKRAHRELAQWRERGEWYAPAPEVLLFIFKLIFMHGHSDGSMEMFMHNFNQKQNTAL